MSSTLIAQLLPILILPFLTRFMGAESFGEYSIFYASVMLLGALTSLRFEYAINAAKDFREATLIVIICYILNITFFFIISAVVLYLIFSDLLNLIWLLLPFSFFSLSINLTYYGLANYISDFNLMGKSKIVFAVSCSVIQFVTVCLFNIEQGAYWGLLLGYCVSNIFLIYKTPINFEMKFITEVCFIAKKYIQYPKLVFPGTLFNSISAQMPIYIIGFVFGSEQSGIYSLATKVAGLPTLMLGRTIGEVFRQKASSMYRKTGSFYSLFITISMVVFIVSLLGFSILYFFSKHIFILLFGIEFSDAALYVNILLPMFFFQFFTAPFGYSLMLTRWQKQEFCWQVFRLFIVSFSIGYAYLVDASIERYLIHISLSFGFTFFIYYLICFKSVRHKSNLAL